MKKKINKSAKSIQCPLYLRSALKQFSFTVLACL